jgi:hypothetical protein
MVGERIIPRKRHILDSTLEEYEAKSSQDSGRSLEYLLTPFEMSFCVSVNRSSLEVGGEKLSGSGPSGLRTQDAVQNVF